MAWHSGYNDSDDESGPQGHHGAQADNYAACAPASMMMATTAADHFNATMATAADNNSEGNFMAMCHGVPLASAMEVVYQGVALSLIHI